jgi:LysM repeat protein
MAQLRQRVSMVIRIDPFTDQDVNAYIDHRLWVAGCEKPKLFTVGARKLIAEHSEGIPRNINNLCFNAMSLACALKRTAIDRDIVRDVIADLDLEPLREKSIVAQKSEKKPERAARSFPLAPKKQPVASDWIPKLVLASVVLLAVGLFFFNVDRGATRSSASQTNIATVAAAPPLAAAPAPAPVVVSKVSLMPPAAPSPQVEPGSQDVQVRTGQTLYQISVKSLGKYDGKVLSQLQDLNPWLSDPDRIHPGQKIRVPAATTNSTESQRAAQQTPNAAPAEAGKQ